MYGVRNTSGMGRTSITRRAPFRLGLGDTTATCPSVEQLEGIVDLTDPCQLPLFSTASGTGTASDSIANTMSSLQLQAAAAASTLPSWALPAAAVGVVLLLIMGGKR
jgi:hypothetical protein